MDAAAILEAAQAAEEEILVPVARWGGILSADCQRFFTEGYETSEAGADVESKYFLEVLRISDPSNLKAGIATVYSILRGYSKYYAALCDPAIIDALMRYTRSTDAAVPDKAAYLVSGLMARYSNKFSADHVAMVLKYSGTEFGKLDVIANLLKYDGYRESIWASEGKRILSGLESSSIPVVYKALFSVWLVGFNKAVLKDIPASVVGAINEVLKNNRTEKVVRIALQAVENLLKSKAMCEEMAEQGTVDLVSALEYEKWRDQELIEAVKATVQALNAEVKVLTNFERYDREVNSGTLRWGFIHTDKFWVENVLKCEAQNFMIIDKLMVILRSSQDAESLAVACHDIGEFARLHPIGKQIATSRGAKDKMLDLMSTTQREVAREALLCVQKLMLQKAVDLSAAVAAQ